MTDRFKFRFWDKKEKEYFTCGDIDHKSGIFKAYPYRTYNWCFGHKNIVAEQCTGLKDKNGQLIYEGDIVKLSSDREVVCSVVWDNEETGFCVEYKKELYRFNTYRKYHLIEVIGNIHENKELLKWLIKVEYDH